MRAETANRGYATERAYPRQTFCGARNTDLCAWRSSHWPDINRVAENLTSITMKFMFPDGEHPAAQLLRGVNRIGASPSCRIVLRGPTAPPLACEIHVFATYAYLVPNADAPVILNGHRIRELMRLRDGDEIELSGTRMRVLSSVSASELESALGQGDAFPAKNLRHRARDLAFGYVANPVPLA